MNNNHPATLLDLLLALLFVGGGSLAIVVAVYSLVGAAYPDKWGLAAALSVLIYCGLLRLVSRFGGAGGR